RRGPIERTGLGLYAQYRRLVVGWRSEAQRHRNQNSRAPPYCGVYAACQPEERPRRPGRYGGDAVNLSEIDLNDLDFSNIANWPLAARVIAILLIAAAVLGLGYWFDIKDQQLRLQQAERKELELKSEFEGKAR